jgi:predicted small secreted protein
MIGPKVRGVMVVLLLMLFTSFLLSSCSTQEIGETIGSCCGVSPLPIAAVGLVMVGRWRKEH